MPKDTIQEKALKAICDVLNGQPMTREALGELVAEADHDPHTGIPMFLILYMGPDKFGSHNLGRILVHCVWPYCPELGDPCKCNIDDDLNNLGLNWTVEDRICSHDRAVLLETIKKSLIGPIINAE